MAAKKEAIDSSKDQLNDRMDDLMRKNKELEELSLEELKAFSPLIEKDIFNALSIKNMIDKRVSFGGTATASVMAAIDEAEKDLENIQS
jgi:argininosuccinate lyase